MIECIDDGGYEIPADYIVTTHVSVVSPESIPEISLTPLESAQQPHQVAKNDYTPR
jgi:hypothetical protein